MKPAVLSPVISLETYTHHTDEQLVVLLRQGDSFAYTEIYERYKSLLYTFTLRRLADKEEAKDLVAELFLAIWDRHKTLTLTSSLAAYLYTSARNRIYDLLAHKKIQGRYIDSFTSYMDEGIENTDHLIRHKELSILIDKEIAALPPKMREVFLLSRETQLSRKEIAAQLSLSEETVKSHMHHALKQLKARLGSFFFLVFF